MVGRWFERGILNAVAVDFSNIEILFYGCDMDRRYAISGSPDSRRRGRMLKRPSEQGSGSEARQMTYLVRQRFPEFTVNECDNTSWVFGRASMILTTISFSMLTHDRNSWFHLPSLPAIQVVIQYNVRDGKTE